MSLDQLTEEGAHVVSRAEVWVDGDKIDEPAIVDGRVIYDATSRVMRNCQVNLVGEIPGGPNDTLAPIASELRLFRGARDWTGEVLEAALGRFSFDKSSVMRTDRSISITGYDYAQLVTDARWEHPFHISQGTNLATAISNAVQSRLSPVLWGEPNLTTTSVTTPNIIWGEEVDNDPMEDIRSLARSDGLEVSFSREGRLTLAPVPDPDTTSPRWKYEAGETPNYLSSGRDLIGRPYNVVVARGETQDNTVPVEEIAEDDDPNSPSYIGRYRKPYFLTSSFIATSDQAFRAAKGELNRLLGLSEVVTMSVIPHPELDVWQVLEAFDPVMKIDSRYVIDNVEIPLRPGEARLVTRRRSL